MNRARILRHPLRALWRVDSFEDYHGLLFDHALRSYLERAKDAGQAPGDVLAVGACWREAQTLVKYPFERIALSGIAEPDEAIQKACEEDPRVRFEYANAEQLPFASASFDLVFCKESLHHLARPVLGFYEMLRVCRRAVILVEPYSCALVQLLDRAGVSTRFERSQRDNLGARDNFVYRWTRRQLEALLCGLYLESGYELDLTVGWLSTRAQVRRPGWVRRLAALGGHLASWIPGARGNFATALIVPGRDLPPDPAPFPGPSRARSQDG
jgi:SAM-dependent methyltransferase